MTAQDTAPTFPEITLRAGDLTLRPLTEADADDVAEACQDAETMRWLPLPRPYTRGNAEWFIGTFGPGLRESGAGIVFAIESAGRLAGVIDLKHVNWAAKIAEVVFSLVPDDLRMSDVEDLEGDRVLDAHGFPAAAQDHAQQVPR